MMTSLFLGRVAGRFEGDRVAHDHVHDLSVGGLVRPLLDGAELADIRRLAEGLLQLGAGGDAARLADDVFLAGRSTAGEREQNRTDAEAARGGRSHETSGVMGDVLSAAWMIRHPCADVESARDPSAQLL